MTEQLTADQLTTLATAADVLARLGPQARAQLEATRQEAEQAAARAEYDAAIAERAARLAASPEYQAQVRESKRQAADEHRREVARLRAMARLSSPPDPRPPSRSPPA